MKISRENYELYLALYLDKQLDPVKTAELMLFLSENADLEIQADDTEHLLLQPDRITFPLKDFLKKDFGDVDQIDDRNFEEFCIASSEGLLDKYNEARLNQFIRQHPVKESELKIFRQLKLKSDPQIHFPGKSTLKKPVRFSPQYRILLLAASVAASIMLVLFIFTGNPENTASLETYTVYSAAADTIIIYEPHPAELYAEITDTEAKSSYIEAVALNRSDYIADADLSDETETKEQKVAVLPLMDPVYTVILTSQNYSSEMAVTKTDPNFTDNGLSGSPDPRHEKTDTTRHRFFDYLRGLDAWETALLAVQGFNLLTESTLSIEKVSDEQGRVTQLIIDTGERTLLATGIKQPNL